jgi:flagellar biosynthetic protein FliR
MTEAQVLAFLLVLTRVSAFVAFFSLFSFRQLPQLIKVAIAVGLSIFWYGQADQLASLLPGETIDSLTSTTYLLREFVIGVMLATALNLFFIPCKIAGAYIGQELGLSLAAISNPSAPDSSTLVTRVFETFTVLIFFSLDMHYFMLLVLDYSFRELADRVDIWHLPTERIVSMLNDSGDYGLVIIAPMACILMIVTVGLAMLNRAAPTLNLFSVGLSLRGGLGILCLVMLLPTLFAALRAYLMRIQFDLEQLLTVLR